MSASAEVRAERGLEIFHDAKYSYLELYRPAAKLDDYWHELTATLEILSLVEETEKELKKIKTSAAYVNHPDNFGVSAKQSKNLKLKVLVPVDLHR